MASQAYVSLTSLGSLPCEVKHYNCIFISLFRGKANPDGYGQRSDSRQKSPQLFLPMTRVVPELGCDFRRNQLRFRTDPKKHSQATWEARDSQSPGLPGIPTIGLGTTAVSPRECLPIGTVCGVGFLYDLESCRR